MQAKSDQREANSEEVAGQISQTRRAMDSTIERLNERIRPHYLMGDLAEWTASQIEEADPREIRKWTDRVGEQVRSVVLKHPVSSGCLLAMAGWIGARTYQSHERKESHSKPDPSAEDGRHSDSDYTPLALGAGLAGLGMFAAMVFPRTEREDQLFGAASDEAVGWMKQRGANLVQTGKKVVLTKSELAAQGVRAVDGDPDSLRQQVGVVAEHVADEMHQKAGEYVQAARQSQPGASLKEGIANKAHHYVDEALKAPGDAVRAAEKVPVMANRALQEVD